MDNKFKEIVHRYKDWSSKDINLYKPLPDWRQIIEDIEYLTNQNLIRKAYTNGYQDAGICYENGYSDGYDEAMDKLGK
jgi:hypothetical protein